VIGEDLSNPVPEWAEHRPDDGMVRYGVAPNMNTPDPDSGEEYPHINTQLFGILDEANRGVAQPEETFNEPAAGQVPTMDGFVADFHQHVDGRAGPPADGRGVRADHDRLHARADARAVGDRPWLCHLRSLVLRRSDVHLPQPVVPSRGAVLGLRGQHVAAGVLPKTNDAETLFDRLDAAGLTWRVYCDPPSHYSLTGVIHAPRLAGKFATNFFSTRQFFEDAENGRLPTYSFIEPQIIGWNHNDMHPPFGTLLQVAASQKGADASDFHFDPPSSLIGGEDLLARIYNAIRSSSSPTGSDHLNTTLLVTFDEHGGTYDHVPPPPAVPPDGKRAPGQMRFTFDRSGVRIPTVAISAWIPERIVINDEYRATSLLATMRERFNLGAPFTAREASAPSFSHIFTLDSPRAQEDWPEITPRPVPDMPESVVPLDAPLGLLGRSLLFSALAMAQRGGLTVPDIKQDDPVTGAQAVAIAHEILGDVFPNMRD
jgi:phospholipase C